MSSTSMPSAAGLLGLVPPLAEASTPANGEEIDWTNAVDAAYLIACPGTDSGTARLRRAKNILKEVGLSDLVQIREFATDDDDRIRGCYSSHIEVLREARATLGSPWRNVFAPREDDYRILVLEDNIANSPRLKRETLDKAIEFSKDNIGTWDMLHLAYIMYVPGLTVSKSKQNTGVVKLSTGMQSALGTTAYIISRRGVESILKEHDRAGYTMPIPDLMAKLFPESRYAAYPMLFHRASSVKSLVNPQLDSLRELLFQPAFYTKVEQLLVATGLMTNKLFMGLVGSLLVASILSGGVVLDALQHPGEQNVAFVGLSGMFSLLSLAILAQGVLLAPPAPKSDDWSSTVTK